MTRSALFRLALVCMTVTAIQHANAASAAATDGRGHLFTSYGQPSKRVAAQHALAAARQRYGAKC